MPTENTQYRGKGIIIGRMADLNTTTMVATKALNISGFVSAFSADTKPRTESFEAIGNAGQQSADYQTTPKFTGTIDFSLATGLLFTLISGVMGKGTQTPLTASAWTATTVTLVGDIVKHSNGKYLVAQKVIGDATTGATEPSIGAEVDYDNLALDGADASNGVIWKLRDTLFNSPDHSTGFCTDKYFIIERVGEGCGSTNVFDRVALNVELSSFNIEKTDGTISQKQSIPWFATSVTASSDVGYQDITVTLEKFPREEIYAAENITVRVNGQKYGTAHNFKIDYTRTIAQVDTIEPKEQTNKVGSPQTSGDITIELDPAEYSAVLAAPKKSVVITFDKGDGEKAIATYPSVSFFAPDVQVNGNEPRLLNISLKPTGNASQAMATWNITTATAE